MKLNLGCGNDVRPGYTNVDFRKTHHSVLEVDLSKYPWPFADESAEEIMMLDFLEHFPYSNTPLIILECYRILKPDGLMIVQVPDGLQTARALIQEGAYLCNLCETKMDGSICKKCGATADEVSHAAVMRLYGGQDYVGNYHQTVFTAKLLVKYASDCGFVEHEFVEEDHMWRNWTLKAIFKKGDIW